MADDVRDEEAVALLKRAAARTGGSGAAGGAADTATSVAPDPPAFEREITLTAGDLELAAHLAIPDRATGAVIFALIVGGSDEVVLDLNRQARQQLTCENELAVIPGATRLFEEPGALEQVAELAAGWFTSHLVAQAAGTVPAG